MRLTDHSQRMMAVVRSVGVEESCWPLYMLIDWRSELGIVDSRRRNDWFLLTVCSWSPNQCIIFVVIIIIIVVVVVSIENGI